jgi:hypothetical protein
MDERDPSCGILAVMPELIKEPSRVEDIGHSVTNRTYRGTVGTANLSWVRRL